MNDLKAVHEWIDAHYDEMEQKLLELLSIDSVRGEAEPGLPFGPGPGKALSFCLELAEKQGFATDNMDGYMGIVDLPGEEEEQIGILSHVDVVPVVPEDWTYPPFAGQVADNILWGRGVLDDKGPLMACQYALMALKETGCNLRRSVRHLLGTNEETGMACIEYFAKNSPVLPVMGFAPDAVFPVVAGEKGLLRWTCSAQWEEQTYDYGIYLSSFQGGTEINCVPAQAEAVLMVDPAGWEQLQQAAAGHDIVLDRDGNQVTVSALGLAAHAAFPEKGDNAIIKVLSFLADLDMKPSGAGDFVRKVLRLLEDWRTGSGLGIDGKDEYSALTNLLSLMEISSGKGSFSCDTRFPVTWDGDNMVAKLEYIARGENLEFCCWLRMDPLFYGEDYPLVKTLLRVYREQTGDNEPPRIIGTGSYARKLPDFVAFGPIFPDQENIIHQADERISRENLSRLAHIYAEAIYSLANLE